MENTTAWWLLAGGLVALELVTGTFYLLMLAVGVAAGALAAHVGWGLTAQLVAAAAVGVAAVLVWQRWGFARRPPANANQDVNLDIGQTVHVAEWQADGTAHVRYRGADWTVSLAEGPSNPPHPPGTYRIVAVQGSRLVVQA
jgi:membrane protein implicated in regulation of membrane protease activity